MIRAHIHPQESGWEMRAALSTWRTLVKDFIPTVYPDRSAEKTLDVNLWLQDFTSYPKPSPSLPHCCFDGMTGEEKESDLQTHKVLGPSGSSWKGKLVQSKHPLGTHTPGFAKQRPSQWVKTVIILSILFNFVDSHGLAKGLSLIHELLHWSSPGEHFFP